MSLPMQTALQPETGARSERDRSWWALPLLLLALCAALLFWRLGAVPLDDFDEAYYAAGAREMLDRGDLGIPYFNGQPFLLKPILIFWLIAAAFQLFGVTEFAARSVSAFFATAIVLATFAFAARTVGRRAAFLAGVSLTLGYLWIDTGREAMTDMPLTAALAPAMFIFFLATRAEMPSKRWALATAYLLLGVALLAKGPVTSGVVIAGLVGFLLSERRLGAALREVHLLPGLALTLAVAAPWYVYASIREPDFVHTFLIQEHFGHLKGELARSDHWWGHLKNLIVGFLPWAAFLPAALVNAFRGEPDRGSGVLRFCAWWGLTVIAAFSVAGAKLPHYLVPALPPLAILIGAWFDSWVERRSGAGLSAGFGLALTGALGLGFAAVGALAAAQPPWLRERIAEQFGAWRPGPAPVVMLGALALGALAAAAAGALGRRAAVFPALAVAMMVAAFAHIGWFKPRHSLIQSQPRKELSVYAGRVLPHDEPLGVFEAKRNATIFYARLPIVDLGEWRPEELVEFLSSPGPATALTHRRRLPLVQDQVPGAWVRMERGDFVLIANHRTGPPAAP